MIAPFNPSQAQDSPITSSSTTEEDSIKTGPNNNNQSLKNGWNNQSIYQHTYQPFAPSQLQIFSSDNSTNPSNNAAITNKSGSVQAISKQKGSDLTGSGLGDMIGEMNHLSLVQPSPPVSSFSSTPWTPPGTDSNNSFGYANHLIPPSTASYNDNNNNNAISGGSKRSSLESNNPANFNYITQPNNYNNVGRGGTNSSRNSLKTNIAIANTSNLLNNYLQTSRDESQSAYTSTPSDLNASSPPQTPLISPNIALFTNLPGSHAFPTSYSLSSMSGYSPHSQQSGGQGYSELHQNDFVLDTSSVSSYDLDSLGSPSLSPRTSLSSGSARSSIGSNRSSFNGGSNRNSLNAGSSRNSLNESLNVSARSSLNSAGSARTSMDSSHGHNPMIPLGHFNSMIPPSHRQFLSVDQLVTGSENSNTVSQHSQRGGRRMAVIGGPSELYPPSNPNSHSNNINNINIHPGLPLAHNASRQRSVTNSTNSNKVVSHLQKKNNTKREVCIF